MFGPKPPFKDFIKHPEFICTGSFFKLLKYETVFDKHMYSGSYLCQENTQMTQAILLRTPFTNDSSYLHTSHGTAVTRIVWQKKL